LRINLGHQGQNRRTKKISGVGKKGRRIEKHAAGARKISSGHLKNQRFKEKEPPWGKVKWEDEGDSPTDVSSKRPQVKIKKKMMRRTCSELQAH